MTRNLLAVLSAVGLALVLSDCAHAPAGKGADPGALLADACRPGSANQSVKGSVWMKLESPEAKGQFPAEVSATAPDSVLIEVTNLLGSREALINVDHGKYSVEIPSKGNQKGRHAEGAGSWGGIPLRWASELFLGRIPCPSTPSTQAASGFASRVDDSGDLTVQGNGEKFVYHFRQWAGHPWPESLHWEGSTSFQGERSTTIVDFKFDEPDDKSGSPKKWEAKSSRGEVKLRWRDLQVVSLGP